MSGVLPPRDTSRGVDTTLIRSITGTPSSSTTVTVAVDGSPTVYPAPACTAAVRSPSGSAKRSSFSSTVSAAVDEPGANVTVRSVAAPSGSTSRSACSVSATVTVNADPVVPVRLRVNTAGCSSRTVGLAAAMLTAGGGGGGGGAQTAPWKPIVASHVCS